MTMGCWPIKKRQWLLAWLSKTGKWLLAWLPETGNGCWAVLSEHALVANSLTGLTTSKFLRQNIDPALEVVNVHITALKGKKSKIYYQLHI